MISHTNFPLDASEASAYSALMSATEIQVPASGPVILPDGRVLRTNDLRAMEFNQRGWRGNAMAVSAAAREGQILCLRPSTDPRAKWDGKFCLSTDEALALVDKGGDAWIIAVDPYDSDGELIAFDGTDLRTFAADRVGKVAA